MNNEQLFQHYNQSSSLAELGGGQASPPTESHGLLGPHESLLRSLERGSLRVAEPDLDQESGWRVNSWVKEAILDGFRRSSVVAMEGTGSFFDKSGYPPRRFGLEERVRLVPGGSAIRRGAYVAPGVVVMPPAYVNVGAWVGEDSMIDSHALVGSCAQIGQRVHLSAGAQIGGVLEPSTARPVIVEDDVFVGGLAGLFEGLWVQRRAVIAAGVVLTASTPIYDLVNERVVQGVVPENAVVVPGVRPASGAYAAQCGLGVQTAVIVKYRDESTEAAVALEEALR